MKEATLEQLIKERGITKAAGKEKEKVSNATIAKALGTLPEIAPMKKAKEKAKASMNVGEKEMDITIREAKVKEKRICHIKVCGIIKEEVKATEARVGSAARSVIKKQSAPKLLI